MAKKEEIKEEPVEQPLEKVDESEEEITDEEVEDEGLPFPMAPVVRHIKKNVEGKMISSKVKVAVNKFLGEVVDAVSKDMGKTRYSMVEMDDFIRSTKPYSYAKELELEKERVVKELESMRFKIDGLIREFQRKFSIERPDEFNVLPKSESEEELPEEEPKEST